tara:strand:+ start:31 stop:336 length:306 start_codon:yes stop_codon:yes gene_type:complete
MPFNDYRIPEIGDNISSGQHLYNLIDNARRRQNRNQPKSQFPSSSDKSNEIFHELEFKRMQDQSKQRDIEDMKKLKYPPNQKWMLDNRIAFDSPFRDAFGG